MARHAIDLDEAHAQPSPGLLSKHYSPRAQVLLFVGAQDAMLVHMHQRAIELLASGRRRGLLIAEEDRPAFQDVPAAHVEVLGSKHDLPGVARGLFAAMRRLDSRAVDTILARSFGLSGIGLAIQDRPSAGPPADRWHT